MSKFLEILHVGGREDIGLATSLWEKLGYDVGVTVFEADPTIPKAGLPEVLHKVKIISKGLSNYTGRAKFNINVGPSASSLFKISPKAVDYCAPTRWGETCKTVRTIEIDITTIDRLYMDHEIILPHFMSLDAQGSEYDILEKATTALNGDLVGIITEVEFREIYAGQKLFTDQDNFLRKYNFELHNLFNRQNWSYTKYYKGTGFPVVAEALYLRDFHYFIKRNDTLSQKLDNLKRLIGVAACYNKLCYAHIILSYIKAHWFEKWDDFLKGQTCSYFLETIKLLEKIAIEDKL